MAMDGGWRLVALIVPGSVEAEIAAVQARIFREHGLTSAVAVPPLVPVAFVGETPRGLLGDLDAAVSAPWSMRTAVAAWIGGALYARLDTEGAWEAVRAGALERCGHETAALFPVGEGFFLGCGDAPQEERAAIRPSIPALSFSSCSVAVVQLEAPDPAAWWRELYWEVLEERPLRGRRQR
ncbi:MAG TPA: hypothetical protein VHE79_09625 [Spirochaetia bacterium]